MLNRRAFLSGAISVALASPLVANGNQAGKDPRVGFLFQGGASPFGTPFIEAFRDGLRGLGYGLDGVRAADGAQMDAWATLSRHSGGAPPQEPREIMRMS